MFRVAGLFIYPVKSMRAVPLESAQVQLRGLYNDRRWLVTDADNVFMTQRNTPELAQFTVVQVGEHLQIAHPEAGLAMIPVPKGAKEPVKIWNDTVQAVATTKMAEQWMSKALNRPAKLFHMPPDSHRWTHPDFSKDGDHVSFADGFPLLVTNQASLEELNTKLAEPVGMDRFRSNVVIENASAFEETTWSRVVIGDLAFRVVKPCGRCIVTTTDQETGERKGEEPLATLARDHLIGKAAVFGMNLIPDGEGVIKVGDEVSVELRSEPWA